MVLPFTRTTPQIVTTTWSGSTGSSALQNPSWSGSSRFNTPLIIFKILALIVCADYFSDNFRLRCKCFAPKSPGIKNISDSAPLVPASAGSRSTAWSLYTARSCSRMISLLCFGRSGLFQTEQPPLPKLDHSFLRILPEIQWLLRIFFVDVMNVYKNT